MTDDTPTDDGRWIEQAHENIDTWGPQPPAVLILALVEEIGEVVDALLATAEPPLTDPVRRAEAMYLLTGVRQSCFDCREFLKANYETVDGEPIRRSARPTLVHDLDAGRVRDELDDAAALVYQLDWALDHHDETHGPR